MCYKLAAATIMLANEGGNLRSLMGICSFAVLMICVCGAYGTTWAALEMRQLLNSWEPLFRSSSDDLMPGKKPEALSNVVLSVKVILVACTAFCVAIDAAAFSLVFPDLPVCVFPLLAHTGLIPADLLPQ